MSNIFEKAWGYTLTAFLVIGTIFYLPIKGPVTDPVAYGYWSQEMFFRYGTIVLLMLSQLFTPLRRLDCKWLSLFVVYLVISSLIIGFSATQRHSLLNVFIWFLLYKTIYENFRFDQIKKYAFWLGVILFINFFMCALQYNGIDILFTSVSEHKPGLLDTVIGFMKIKAFLGLIATLLLPIVVCYAPIFSLCIIPLLFFGVSSAAIVAVIINSAIMSATMLPKRISLAVAAFMLVCGVLFIGLYDAPKGQFGERLKTWQGTTSLALKGNPIIGKGIGSFKEVNFATMQSNGEPIVWRWVHNEFIQAFYEIGIIGLVFILGFLAKLQRYFSTKDRLLLVLYCSFVSVVVISFFHFPFHLARFSHLLAFFIAIYHARGVEVKHA